MKLKIRHNTQYEYNAAVFFEPHILRFKPAQTAYTRLHSFHLSLDPVPVGLSERKDTEGNTIHTCWFEGLRTSLMISAESVISIEEFNPFNFLVYPKQYLTFPFHYEGTEAVSLGLYLQKEEISDGMKEIGASIRDQTEKNTLDFILELTRHIHRQYAVIEREKGAPYSPEVTFDKRSGSCRDLSWMQIQWLRNLGIAARFVSGYYFFEMEKPEFELHAWMEAYIPGAGWTGFDPSHGVMTGNTHIPVASSAFHTHTLPVEGSVRGDGVAKLITDLTINPIS